MPEDHSGVGVPQDLRTLLDSRDTRFAVGGKWEGSLGSCSGRYQSMKLGEILFRVSGWLGGDAGSTDTNASDSPDPEYSGDVEVSPAEYGEHPL